MQEGKWLSKEALQTAEKRREVKGKGERERYTQLNAEFQRRRNQQREGLTVKSDLGAQHKNSGAEIHRFC